ncbi:MAG: YHS domain-containing protein [Myxococcota bacterium]|jgi:YHS domain-containing protein
MTTANAETSNDETPAKKPVDPVCGAPVDPKRTGYAAMHEGQYFQFCSTSCLRKFAGNPTAFVE